MFIINPYRFVSAPAGGITLVGYVTGSRIGAASGTTALDLTALTGGSGTTALEGDLVIALEGVFGASGTGFATTGYTSIVDTYYEPGENSNIRVSYKFMGSTPDTTLEVNSSGNFNGGQSFAAIVLRGVDSVTPQDVTAVTANSGGLGNAQANPPSITPTTSGAWVLGVGVGSTSGSGETAYDFTSSDYDTFLSIPVQETIGGTLGAGLKAWTSGAFDAAAFGQSTAFGTIDGNWQAISIALRPA